MGNFYSIFYSVIIGCFFVYIFIFVYDFLYGEKQGKQIKKIHKYFRKDEIIEIKMTEQVPRKYTRYNVVTNNGVQKIKMKPGYKVVKIVTQKENVTKPIKSQKRTKVKRKD